MNFRYFDAEGRPLTWDQLREMRVVTPAMEHVFATVEERAGNGWKAPEHLADGLRGGYNGPGTIVPGGEEKG